MNRVMNRRMLSRLSMVALLGALSALTICCSDDGPPPGVGDVGLRDGGPGEGGVDGAMDATIDTAFDTDLPGDATTIVDTGPVDTIPPPEDSRPPVDPCEGVTPTTCPDPCPAGSVCTADSCERMSCVPGRSCATDADCGGNTCVIPDGMTRGTCMAAAGDCTTSASCPAGSVCESGSCVNRRIPCGSVVESCPRCYVCSFEPGMAAMFCTLAHNRCTTDAQCELGYTCGDIDGDGMNECRPPGACAEHSDCRSPLLCTVNTGSSVSECSLDGPCGGGVGCGAGRECLDISNGEGPPLCMKPGSCSSNSDCPAGQICAAGGLHDTLACIGGGS